MFNEHVCSTIACHIALQSVYTSALNTECMLEHLVSRHHAVLSEVVQDLVYDIGSESPQMLHLVYIAILALQSYNNLV